MNRITMLLLTLACLTGIADAAPPKPDVKKDCAEIGEVAHAFAGMRDIGMTLARAREIIKPSPNEFPPRAEGVDELFNYIVLKVYTHPEMLPAKLRILVEEECLKSEGKMSASWR